MALFPALAGCSSSSTDYAANVYPSRLLADLLKGSAPDSTPPARTTDAPAPPSSSTAAAAAAPVAPAVPTAPASSAPADDSDPAAAVYPSVSLSDLLLGSTKPAAH
jgi:hypothetical protein